MAGNVFEWTRSKHVAYPYDPTDGREEFSSDNDLLVVRGGSWAGDANWLRCAYRHWVNPNFRNYYRGFRVVCVPISTSGL